LGNGDLSAIARRLQNALVARCGDNFLERLPLGQLLKLRRNVWPQSQKAAIVVVNLRPIHVNLAVQDARRR
jgi:hypothetical protein